MGSPDRYGRQLNGMGGGLSSLSKLVVVRPSKRPEVDVEVRYFNVPSINNVISKHFHCKYTFVQMGIKDGLLDLSGEIITSG